jgi:hydrogenase maturation protease
MKSLLLGMGNPILCDDAVGIRLARAVADRLGPREGLDVVDECSVGGLNLVEVMAGYDRVVVLDSIMTEGGVPGTWFTFDAGALRETLNLRNVHDVNFATALELGRTMGTPLPADECIRVYAVEVDDTVTFSETMTPGLEAALPELAEEIGAEIAALLRGGALTDVAERRPVSPHPTPTGDP